MPMSSFYTYTPRPATAVLKAIRNESYRKKGASVEVSMHGAPSKKACHNSPLAFASFSRLDEIFRFVFRFVA